MDTMLRHLVFVESRVPAITSYLTFWNRSRVGSYVPRTQEQYQLLIKVQYGDKGSLWFCARSGKPPCVILVTPCQINIWPPFFDMVQQGIFKITQIPLINLTAKKVVFPLSPLFWPGWQLVSQFEQVLVLLSVQYQYQSKNTYRIGMSTS